MKTLEKKPLASTASMAFLATSKSFDKFVIESQGRSSSKSNSNSPNTHNKWIVICKTGENWSIFYAGIILNLKPMLKNALNLAISCQKTIEHIIMRSYWWKHQATNAIRHRRRGISYSSNILKNIKTDLHFFTAHSTKRFWYKISQPR